MINLFELIIKGFFIGLAKIIPGFSGAVLALSLGVYETTINKITNFFKDVKNNISYFFKLGIGLVFGICFGAVVIKWFILNFYYLTMFLFVGLIVGTISKFDFKIKNNRQKIIYIILSVVFTLLLLKSSNNNQVFIYENTFLNKLYVAFLGFVDAFSTVVPGISGTAIFMSMGCYDFILNLFSNLWTNFNVTFIFFFGLIFGILLITRIINYLFKVKPVFTYNVIYILSISSLFMMILNMDYSNIKIIDIIISFLSLFLGIYISKKN